MGRDYQNNEERMQARKLTVRSELEYTPIRRFYAWVGFTTLVLLSVGTVWFLIWANAFINAAVH